MKTIDQYKNFGDWGQERGGQLLDTISQLLGQASGVANQEKERKQKKAYGSAIANLLGQYEGIDTLVPNDYMASAYDLKTRKPITEDIGQGPINTDIVTKSTQQKLQEMDPAYTEKLLGLFSEKAKASNKSSGNNMDEITKLENDIAHINSLMTAAVAKDKPAFYAVLAQKQARLKALNPAYGKEYGIQTTKIAEADKVRKVSNIMAIPENNRAYQKFARMNPGVTEAEWAEQQGLLK